MLLRDKLTRAGATPELLEKFQSLLELNNLVDVRPVVRLGRSLSPTFGRSAGERG